MTQTCHRSSALMSKIIIKPAKQVLNRALQNRMMMMTNLISTIGRMRWQSCRHLRRHMCLKWIDDKPKFSIAQKRTSFHSLLKIVKTAEGCSPRTSLVTRITAQPQLQRQLHRIRQCHKSANRPEQQRHHRCNLRRHLQPRESAGKVRSDQAVSATP